MAMLAEHRSFEGRGWPMTREALAALEATEADLSREATAVTGRVRGQVQGERGAPTPMPNVEGQQLLRRLATVRSVLAQATVVSDPGCVVIGRWATVRENDGTTARYEVVIPGDGDVASNRVGADSPVGAALTGRRLGETVTIAAPAGSWTVTVIKVE
jgi:transcription elongation GreA/GreB family factor